MKVLTSESKDFLASFYTSESPAKYRRRVE